MVNGGQGIGELMLMRSAMGGPNMAGSNPSQGIAAAKKPSASAIKILTNYFQTRGIPLQQGLAAVQKELSQGLRLMQYGNSVLAIKDLGQGVAQIHFFTVDTEGQLKEDIKHFVDLMRKAGIHTIYDKDADPVFMQAAKEFGVDVQQSDNPQFKLKATL
jgi:hypothetical protein